MTCSSCTRRCQKRTASLAGLAAERHAPVGLDEAPARLPDHRDPVPPRDGHLEAPADVAVARRAASARARRRRARPRCAAASTRASSSTRALAKAMGVERLNGMATSGSPLAAPANVPRCVERRDEGDRARALVAVERLEHAGAREVRDDLAARRARASARRRRRAPCAAWRGTRSSRPGGRPRRGRATGSRCSARRDRAAPCGRGRRTRTRT